MLRTFGVVAALLAVVWAPLIGDYVAIVLVTLAALPVVHVRQLMGPLAARIGDATGQSADLVAVEAVVLTIAAIAVVALVKSRFAGRNAEEYGSLGIALLGMLAIAGSSFLRFRFHY